MKTPKNVNETYLKENALFIKMIEGLSPKSYGEDALHNLVVLEVMKSSLEENRPVKVRLN